MNRWICLLLLCTTAYARPKVAEPATPTGASWSPSQAIGAPDVPAAGGDDARAWATLYADSGLEWLELSYPKAVTVAQVNIHENFNPGAVSKVVARNGEQETVMWEGTSEARTGSNVLRLKAARSTTADTIRVYLDTTRVSGWNEIDAVELVGLDGSKQWAKSATASSSYASSGGGGGGTLQTFVGKTVRLMSGGVTHTAKLVRQEDEFLVLERNGKTVLVATAAVQLLELQ